MTRTSCPLILLAACNPRWWWVVGCCTHHPCCTMIHQKSLWGHSYHCTTSVNTANTHALYNHTLTHTYTYTLTWPNDRNNVSVTTPCRRLRLFRRADWRGPAPRAALSRAAATLKPSVCARHYRIPPRNWTKKVGRAAPRATWLRSLRRAVPHRAEPSRAPRHPAPIRACRLVFIRANTWRHGGESVSFRASQFKR